MHGLGLCRWSIVALIGMGVPGCSSPRPTFDGDRAFADLATQVGFGPRVPRTDAHRQCADWLETRLSGLADTVWVQRFNANDTLPLVNIIARFVMASDRRVLLGAHWDSRPWADQDSDPARRVQPCEGANDGASGVAVLLEIARALDSLAPPIGVDIALFDGEDGGSHTEIPGDWCLGSQHFASHLPGDYDWVIIIDMVGDAELSLPQETYSHRLAPELTDWVWARAHKAGEPAFRAELGPEVFDDHIPFLMRGIPAVDIIDFDYPYWHTAEDTPDKCSSLSLATVGRVLIEAIYSW